MMNIRLCYRRTFTIRNQELNSQGLLLLLQAEVHHIITIARRLIINNHDQNRQVTQFQQEMGLEELPTILTLSILNNSSREEGQ